MQAMSEYGIGNTPMRCVPGVSNGNEILIKQEGANYLGSVKARTAYWLVASLTCDRTVTIVESSSGNLALALTHFCRIDGRPFLCLVDRTMMQDKLNALRCAGADIELVSTRVGMDERDSRIARAGELDGMDEFEWTNQYDNENGILAHYHTTGLEILNETDKKVDYLICAVGSGGTIVGVSRRLKESIRDLRTLAVEPFGSTIHAHFESPYLNAGAGMRGAPGNIRKNHALIDEWVVVHDDDSIRRASELNAMGMSCGITTGMAYHAALELSRTVEDKKIVIVSPDGGEMYGEVLTGRVP